MFVYSFNPIPPVNTFTDHTGFIIICFALACHWFFYMAMTDDGMESLGWWVRLTVSSIVFSITGFVSFTTGHIAHYTNEPITATLVGFQTEGYITREHSGKTTRDVDHHYQYVVYKLPNNEQILMSASVGVSYPTYATLYKNPAKN